MITFLIQGGSVSKSIFLMVKSICLMAKSIFFNGKKHEKKEFQNSNVDGKNIEILFERFL